MTTGVGEPTDGNISKIIVAINVTKIRNKLLAMEDLYYSFRDEIETSLQEVKYRLDKLAQIVGDTNET